MAEMKKLIGVFLSAALCMSLTVPALAADMTTEEGLAPLSLTVTDGYGSVNERSDVPCKYVLASTSAYHDYISMDTLNGYYPVASDCRITVANQGGSQDCHIRVYLYEQEEMTRSELLTSRGITQEFIQEAPAFQEMYDEICKALPQADSKVYVSDEEGEYLATDGSWATYIEFGFENLKRIQEGQSCSFSLPNAKEGKLYKLQVEVCYPDEEYPRDEQCAYSYRYMYLKVDSKAASEQSTPVVGGFSDVKADSYCADAVLWAVEKGITNGTTATTFSPNATCTTAQILTFLWRANGSPEMTGANPFSDVVPGSFCYEAALWAAKEGLVSGSTFNGNAPCTRAATVTYLWKLAGKPTVGTANFSDVSADADYAQAVAWAVREGITNGTTATTFSPSNTCTRGQIVTFLHRDMA